MGKNLKTLRLLYQFLCLSMLAASSGLYAADMSALVGTWVGKTENLANADEKHLGSSPAVMDIFQVSEGGFEVYLTLAALGQKVKDFTYEDGILAFDYGVPGILPFAPVRAKVTDGNQIQFDWRPSDPSINEFVRVTLSKKELPAVTDSDITGTYRGSLLDPYDIVGNEQPRSRYDIVLNLNVSGDEASGTATMVKTNADPSERESHRKQTFEFKRIIRIGSRFFLHLRTEEESIARLESWNAKRSKPLDPRMKELMTDTFHVWLEGDGRIHAMVAAYIGNAEGILKKDPPADEAKKKGPGSAAKAPPKPAKKP